ncbi:MAG: PBSX family phage terminase large subunit, partial [Oscillospiraceae bacterium]
RQMYCLGIYYNKALLAIETNFSTFPVQELSRLGYPNLYNREVPDTYTGKLKKSYGFQTNAQTRPVLVAEFVEMAREAIETICDRETLGEMLTFVRNEKGRPEAESGKHDDLVMAYGIALQGRKQQRMTVLTKKEQQPEKLIKKLKKAGAKEIRL